MNQALPRRTHPALLALEWLPRLAVGALFLYTGWSKLAEPANFIKEISAYQLLPVVTINFVAYVLPWLEILSGALLIVGFWRREARALLAALLVVFLAAKIIAQPGECGCLSTDSPIYFLFKDWHGYVTNVVLLGLLALEWLLERRRRPRRGGPPRPATLRPDSPPPDLEPGQPAPA